MTTAWLLLALAVLLIALNALFVAVEFAFITVDRPRVEKEADSGDRRAQALLRGLKSLTRQLSGAQLGITVTSLILGYVAEPSIAELLRPLLDTAGLPAATSGAAAITLAFILATFTQMVFGELVPKNWAIAEPRRVARLVVGPHRLFMIVFGWLVHLLDSAANTVVRWLGFEPTDELASARTAEELSAVVRRSGEVGTLDPRTAELVARSIEFGDRTASEVMMPRPTVRFFGADDPVADVIAAAAASGHSRYPVQAGNVDEIAGVVHFKQALAVPFEERATTPIRAVMSEPLVVAESMTLDPLLRELRRPGLQVAVVVDEYGGTAGIVTLEDLIEEIVGEIEDEQDPHLQRFRRTPDGQVVVSGLLRPDEVGEIVRLVLPEGHETETIAGLLAERLDRLPEVGDVVDLEARDEAHLDDNGLPTPAALRLTVHGVDGYRVDRVAVRRRDAGTEDGS